MPFCAQNYFKSINSSSTRDDGKWKERGEREREKRKNKKKKKKQKPPPVKPVLVIFNFLGVTSIPGHSKGSRSITFM